MFLVHEISIAESFNDINHGYRAALLNKSSLWLLPSYMAVATYCYYEKVRRTMRTTIVSYIFIVFFFHMKVFSVASNILNSI